MTTCKKIDKKTKVASDTKRENVAQLQNARRDSVRTTTSWSNPWEEPLPKSSPPHSTNTQSIDSKREQEHSSHQTRSGSTFPMTKRNGWFSSLISRLRPAAKPSLLSFESLTKIRCFGEIMIRLSDENINKEEWLKCRGYVSPLHFLLQYRPPLVVVNTVILELKALGQECPETICDSKGRNSLHIACAAVPSNTVAVIARLVSGQSIHTGDNPAAALDHQKMLPLHHACSGKIARTDEENRVLIVRFLTEYYPPGACTLNNRGKSPSDLVRLHSKNPELLMVLYQCIVDQRKVATTDVVASSGMANKQRSSYDLGVCDNHDDKQCISKKNLIQKYTKSEHRRDGLAALVQRNDRRLPNAATENTPPVVDQSDEISELESMYTSIYVVDYSSVLKPEGNNPETPEQPSLLGSNCLETSESEGVDSDKENGERDTEGDADVDNDRSVFEYLQLTEESVDVSSNILENKMQDDAASLDGTMQYSISERLDDIHEFFKTTTTSKTNSISQSDVDDKLKSERRSVDIDEASISISSSSDESASTCDNDINLLYGEDTPTTPKKNVKFNDCVKIHNLSDSSSQYLLCDVDHTDPTESETSTSNNPLDDSDRGSYVSLMISETPASTHPPATTTTTMMMQKYGGNKVSEYCLSDIPNEKLPEEKLSTGSVDTFVHNLYFL